jgi:hypothetical protein
MVGRQTSESDIYQSQNVTTSNDGMLRRLAIKIAKIKAVNADTNKVDLEWLAPNRGAVTNVDISRPYVGIRSGMHFMPEVGSIVLFAYAGNRPVLLSYLLPADYDKMLNAVDDVDGLPSRINKILPGELLLNSKQNSEIYIHEQIEIRDGGQDSIVLDPNDGSINLDSLQFYMTNEGGSVTMGSVVRNINGDPTIITNDGSDITSTIGGNALTELKITVASLADNTINDSTPNPNIAEVTIGTLIGSDGTYTTTDEGTKINLEIKMKSGIVVRFDENGKMFVDTNNIKMNNSDTLSVNSKNIDVNAANNVTAIVSGNTNVGVGKDLTAIVSGNTTITSKKININGGNEVGVGLQHAARENDQVTIPIANVIDTTHPGITTKSLQNTASLLTGVPTCFKVFGVYPVIFTPTSVDFKLVGEITEGSSNVYIGEQNP